MDSTLSSELPAIRRLSTQLSEDRKRNLGRGAAKRSDPNTRVCRLKASNIQRAVAQTIQDQAASDPFGKIETLARLQSYMVSKSVPEQINELEDCGFQAKKIRAPAAPAQLALSRKRKVT